MDINFLLDVLPPLVLLTADMQEQCCISNASGVTLVLLSVPLFLLIC